MTVRPIRSKLKSMTDPSQPLESELVEEANENGPQTLTNGPGSQNAAISIPTARVIGKPFQKGVSGNPSGRPKDALGPTVRRLLSAEKLEEHVQKVIAAADNGDMRAVQLLWERGWGKPAMADEDREAIANSSDPSWILAAFGMKR